MECGRTTKAAMQATADVFRIGVRILAQSGWFFIREMINTIELHAHNIHVRNISWCPPQLLEIGVALVSGLQIQTRHRLRRKLQKNREAQAAEARARNPNAEFKAAAGLASREKRRLIKS